jgi:hypothetical protein
MDMNRLFGVVAAGFTAAVIGFAAVPSANAAPTMTGTGTIVTETMPTLTEDVRWRGGRGFRHGGWRGHRFNRHRHFGYYRPYRPAFYRPAYYGPSCFIRPARQVWTPYGWRFRPAARICRW